MDKVRFCGQPGCTGLAVNSPFCPEHVSDNYKTRAEKRLKAEQQGHGWYSRRAWRDRLRPMKLRHNPICEKCEREPATEVHHVDDSWKNTGDWRLFIDLANLMSLCKSCHSGETAEATNKKKQERAYV